MKRRIYYTIGQAAEAIGVHYRKVYHAIETHVIRPLQAGRSRLLTAEEVNVLRDYFARKQSERGAKAK